MADDIGRVSMIRINAASTFYVQRIIGGRVTTKWLMTPVGMKLRLQIELPPNIGDSMELKSIEVLKIHCMVIVHNQKWINLKELTCSHMQTMSFFAFPLHYVIVMCSRGGGIVTKWPNLSILN